MKGNFVQTIIKSMLILALLIALIGMTNAEAQLIVGSWNCKVEGTTVFLVTFNLGGTLTATDSDAKTSDYHGTWEVSGPNTFESTDFSFNRDCLVETYTINTMPDNDTIVANAVIEDCDGDKIVPPTLTCERITITPLSP